MFNISSVTRISGDIPLTVRVMPIKAVRPTTHLHLLSHSRFLTNHHATYPHTRNLRASTVLSQDQGGALQCQHEFIIS